MIFGGSATRIAAFALMALIWGVTWLPMKLAAADLPRRRALPPCRLVLPRDCACTRPAVARSSLRADRRRLAPHHHRLLCLRVLGRGERADRHIGDRQPGPDADLPRGDRGLLWAGADHQAPRRRDRAWNPRPRPLVLRADGRRRERHAGSVRPRGGRD